MLQSADWDIRARLLSLSSRPVKTVGSMDWVIRSVLPLTRSTCCEDGVEEVRPSIIELDMEEDIESVRDCGPEFCLGVEAESLVRSEELDRGRVWDWRGWRRDDWCSW